MSSGNRQVRQPFSRGISAAGVKKKSKAPKYPPALDRRVDLRLVKFDVLKPWITDRVTELLGVEDEVLVAMIFNFLEMDQIHSSGAGIHSQLLTFLDVNTDAFMVELWDLLVSAMHNASGISQKFIDEKAAELKRQKEMAEELKRRQQAVEGRVKKEDRRPRWDDDDDGRRDRDRDGRRDGRDRGRDSRDRDRDRSRSRDRRKRSRSRSRSCSRSRSPAKRQDRYERYK